MFFIAAGCLVSEHELGLLELDVTGSAVHALVEVTLVVVLFTDASRIDLACVFAGWWMRTSRASSITSIMDSFRS